MYGSFSTQCPLRKSIEKVHSSSHIVADISMVEHHKEWSGDVFTQRYNQVTKDVERLAKIVDDACLTLCGDNGIVLTQINLISLKMRSSSRVLQLQRRVSDQAKIFWRVSGISQLRQISAG